MTRISLPAESLPLTSRASAAWWFGLAAMGVLALSALVAGWIPLGFSLATVFAFAGLHNWYEFRYFVSQMPPRWGKLRTYFLLSIGGALLLTGLFLSFGLLASAWDWQTEHWLAASSLWNSLLLLWIAALVWLRGRERTGRDWSWIWPVALLLVAAVWRWPQAWDVGMVYLHPLVALWFLDRVLRKHRPHWLPGYYTALALLPAVVAILWWRLAAAPDLPGEDALSLRIAQHAGAHLLTGVSTHLLVATHTLLEMLHYAVWIVAIPLATFGALPWKMRQVPLAKKSAGWRAGLTAVAVMGALVVVGLWGAFLVDYPLTRDVYFTVAIGHVLAEFPFVVRSL